MSLSKFSFNKVDSILPRFEVWDNSFNPPKLIAECSSKDSAEAVIKLFDK